MNKQKLNIIKAAYRKGDNIMSLLRENPNSNQVEDISISYDFQAGSYIKEYNELKEEKWYQNLMGVYAGVIGQYVDEIIKKVESLNLQRGIKVLDAGVGEATSFAQIFNILGAERFERLIGCDLSWSRLKYGEKFVKSMDIHNVDFVMGELGNLPFLDNSIDLVYTIHAVEPNGGREEQILKELYRVAKYYLVLFEPAYELASESARKHMEEHGYITKLYETALKLGCHIEKYELLENTENKKNETGVMVISKQGTPNDENGYLACPVTHMPLEQYVDVLWSEDSMLMYPIIGNIKCLLEDNAIISTQYRTFT